VGVCWERRVSEASGVGEDVDTGEDDGGGGEGDEVDRGEHVVFTVFETDGVEGVVRREGAPGVVETVRVEGVATDGVEEDVGRVDGGENVEADGEDVELDGVEEVEAESRGDVTGEIA